MGGYMYPFPRGTRKSQPYGANPNNGVNPARGHTGDDFAVPVGTPVRAAGDGVIELSSWVAANYLSNPWWLTQMGGDNLVLNCGGNAPTFIYAHLSNSLAEVGQTVRKGQIIGYSGNTGTATTGPHCHVEALPPSWDFNNGTYGRINPEHYFSEYYEDGDDDMPTAKEVADEIFNRPFNREGAWGGQTNLGAVTSWHDAGVGNILNAVAAGNAQTANLIGALAAVTKGEAFDEAKLLAGVQAAAAAGVKAAIDSIETTVIMGEK